MNNQYHFTIQKVVQWTPRFRQRVKSLTVGARDWEHAYEQVHEAYPGWEVSMFWKIWP